MEVLTSLETLDPMQASDTASMCSQREAENTARNNPDNAAHHLEISDVRPNRVASLSGSKQQLEMLIP